MSPTNHDGMPSPAHEIRITSHGKIKNWVTFALEHFQNHEDIPLVLHTFPASTKGKGSVPNGDSGSETQNDGPPVDSAAKGAKPNRLHPSMATIPRLVSVVEIIKREYLKTLDPALAQAGSLSGLHQYNEVRDLEVQGFLEDTVDEEQLRIESLAHALQGRNHLKQKKVAFMRVSLCRKEAPELVRKGITYQQPAVRKLSKSTRARLKKKLRKAHSEIESGS
ncbi:hypothetical protein GSI_05415 [Ganoderma sinense ZZ0214-1]|uniref:Uncharacterized protein n=1 Tax=Ganoderma sinense ZZ0214-1 TaxID=1077348 RepID=A0A2G8SEH6_9APHY|nr:hypothetical protein GSI_05415 [Ganoderma sinense ZZ0214-1]